MSHDLILRDRADRYSVRVQPRAAGAVVLLVLVVTAIGAWSLTRGDFPLPLSDVVASLVGRGDAGSDFIVLELRLPRLMAAILVGACLGVSGAVFQSLTRNPLGSPDFIGLTSGASTGALVMILLLDGSAPQVALGALGGCVITSLVVYLLAFGRGSAGFRLVLIGVGLSAMLEAFNSFLITRARLEFAAAAQVWLIGSLNGRDWSQVVPLLVAVALLLPAAVLLGRRMRLIEMGDDTAQALGVPVERTRFALLAIAVAMAAIAASAAGPIAFVALAAPQLAARVTRSRGANLVGAAAMGALVLVVSDIVAQGRLWGQQFPVGVMTGAVGGAYLIWLLVHEWRRGRG
jgi:iron complex transport system permease protein